MSMRVVPAVAVLMIVAAAAAGSQSPPGGAMPRTPWGDPDIQGVFTTDDELGVPFERPPAMGEREFVVP